MFKAKCHCGNVELSFKKMPASYTVCNCSICRRYGVKWIYFTSKKVSLKEQTPTNKYVWGDETIAFNHCSKCGCVSHYTCLPSSGIDRFAINANLLEDIQLLDNLPMKNFNGAKM